MIVRRIALTYLCRSCNEVQHLSYRVTPYPIGHITSWNKRTVKCYQCGGIAVLSRAKLTTMNDLFGNSYYGFWSCSNNCDFFKKFYPRAMKAAIEPGHACSRVYVKVVENGYPWKCPTCREILAYADERDLAPYKKKIGFI